MQSNNSFYRFYLPSLLAMMLLAMSSVWAEVKLKPHVLASQQAGNVADIVGKTRSSLQSAGFEVEENIVPTRA